MDLFQALALKPPQDLHCFEPPHCCRHSRVRAARVDHPEELLRVPADRVEPGHPPLRHGQWISIYIYNIYIISIQYLHDIYIIYTLGRGSAGSGCASSSSTSTASAAASPGSSAPSSDMCGGCGSLTRQTTTTSSRTISLTIIRILDFCPYGLQENVCNQAARKVCCTY